MKTNFVKDMKKIYKEHDFKDYYYVNKEGHVYKVLFDEKGKVRVKKKMSPFKTKDGYVEYVLTLNNGKKKHIQAQRIVALTYLLHKRTKGKIEVNHKNGKRDDNRVKNLEWVTKSQNIRHSFDVLGKTVWNKGKKKK